MVAILEYLVSPYIMPDVYDVTIMALGKATDLRPNTSDCTKALEHLYDHHLDSVLKSMKAPFTQLLDSGEDGESLFFAWDLAFSDHLSPYMHLFGSVDSEEAQQYLEAFDAYFDQVLSATSKFVKNLISIQNNAVDADITQPVLQNMEAKLTWWRLGFYPAHDTMINLATPMPLFTESTVTAFMMNWNTKHLGLSAVKNSKLDHCIYSDTVCEVSPLFSIHVCYITHLFLRLSSGLPHSSNFLSLAATSGARTRVGLVHGRVSKCG